MKLKFKLTPKSVLEVGIGDFNVCRSKFFWETSFCYLFEPHPTYYLDLSFRTNNLPNVKVYNIAITDNVGTGFLYLMNNCSFIEQANTMFEDKRIDFTEKEILIKFPVTTSRISNFDKGNYDVLFLDTEGSEWWCIKNLISRPLFISVEMRIDSDKNKYTNEILNWLEENNYVRLSESSDKNDDFYIKRSVLDNPDKYSDKIKITNE